MKRICIILLVLTYSTVIYSQSDSTTHRPKVANDTILPYKLFKDQFILHTSLGYSNAPFSLNYEFSESVSKLKYAANMNPVMGIGFAYKWLALNINFRLPGYIRNVREFGKNQYFDLGFKFNIKRVYFEVDLHTYRGFALKNANTINQQLTPDGIENWIRNDINTSSLSINSWYFDNKDYAIKPANGIVGKYNQEIYTPYVKGGINLMGFGADSALVPFKNFDTSKTVLKMKGMSALDFAGVPGFAYINNINGWQFGFWAGLGLALQLKFINQEKIHGGIGLRPRLDLNIMGGYNIKDWFVIFNAKFDNKSIQFNDLTYRQQYYFINITLGHRF